MKNYIKPTANVIELAVKESLSAGPRAQRNRTYTVRNKQQTIFTNLYTSTGVSQVNFVEGQQS